MSGSAACRYGAPSGNGGKDVWAAFFFDGNQFGGVVNSREKWLEVVRAYKREKSNDIPMRELMEYLLCAREYPGATGYMPNFGFRPEHMGPQTLGQWAELNGMDLSVAEEE